MQAFNKLLAIPIYTIVWTYRITLKPYIGQQCRFHPSCSQYMLDAVKKYGPIKGAIKGTIRICKCNPLCKSSGHDPA